MLDKQPNFFYDFAVNERRRSIISIATNPEVLIYKDIRKKILTGELKDGDRLIETSLASRYQASRLHIKSALRLLEQESLAEHIPMSGFIVKGLTEDAFHEIVEMRIALERVLFCRILEVAKDEDISRLKKITRRVSVFLENNMLEDAMLEVDRFYSDIYALSGYTRITEILDTYSDYLKVIRRKSAGENERSKKSMEVLLQIMQALEDRDRDALVRNIERRRLEAE